jgi:uncharacterized protein YodC (DUF2158 family)
MSIKTGDVVVLKSGGLAMTVIEVKDDKIDCHWFAYDQDLKKATFKERELRLVASQSPAP